MNNTEKFKKEYQEPMWISVDDQLPEEYEDALVCTKDGKIEKAYHTYKEWCEDGEMEWRVFETFGHAYILDDDDVVAWMPLPKPYQPESHELKQGLDNADQDTIMQAT